MTVAAVETRVALLDAAIDCLVERGYAATTTAEGKEARRLFKGLRL